MKMLKFVLPTCLAALMLTFSVGCQPETMDAPNIEISGGTPDVDANVTDEVGGVIDGAAATVTDAATDAKDAVAETADAAKDAVAETAEAAQDAVAETAAAAEEAVAETAEAGAEAVAETTEAAEEAVTEEAAEEKAE